MEITNEQFRRLREVLDSINLADTKSDKALLHKTKVELEDLVDDIDSAN